MVHDPFQASQQTPILASLIPPATLLQALYTVPGTVDNECTVLKITNQGNGDANFWIGYGLNGAQPTQAQYFEYNTPVCANSSLTLDLNNIWLPRNTTVWVKSDSGAVGFTLCGNNWGPLNAQN